MPKDTVVDARRKAERATAADRVHEAVDKLDIADKIAVLEVVKAELVGNALAAAKDDGEGY